MSDRPATEPQGKMEIGCPHNAWGIIHQCPVCGTPRSLSPSQPAEAAQGAAPRAERLDPEEVARIVHDIWPVPGCTATVHDHNWGPDSFYGSFAERLVARLSRPSDERVPGECKRFRHDEHCDH